MSLSDREQRMLDEMERQLYAEDPRFASNLAKQSAPLNKRNGLAALLTLAGVLSIAAGVSMNLPLVGVAGFLAALFGLYEIIMSAARKGGSATNKKAPAKNKTSISKRAEERFRRRREGDF
ncbi:MAG: hypothetical protein RLZZ330_796 [Actinomycetota bacterium]|jgi:hypothetical protein